jgi:serine/threonine protein kinase
MEQDFVAVGAVLAGRYRIERVLGRGGMGIVVQAMHLQLQQPVAMKFLLPEMLGNPQIVQRFLREAQAAVRLKSEHVARVLDVGSLETGAPYMVLEYLEGTDLASFPRSQLGVGGIIDLLLQACEALAEAHAFGIVHRDIKPANFFLTRGADGAPLLKVLDFGISKAPAAGGQLTATQAVMGTPAYMSPEQMRSSRDVDHRSDIWSLGVVLYELLQGAPPFGGDTFSSMVLKVVNDPLPRLTVRLPDGLDSVVYRCLEKEPGRRFQDVAALALALARYAHSETQAAISVRRTRSIVGAEPLGAALEPGVASHAAPSTLSVASGARMALRRGGRRWAIAAAIAGLIGSIVVVVIASRGGGGPPATSPMSPLSPVAPTRSPVATTPPPAPPPVVSAPPPAVPAPPPAAPPPPVAPASSSVPPRAADAVVTAPAAPPAPAAAQPGTPATTQANAPSSAVLAPDPAAATAQSKRAKQPRTPARAPASDAKPAMSDARPAASPASSAKPLAKPARPANPKPPADDDPLSTRN